MSASVRPQRRRIAALCAGTALLALSATACGLEDGAAVGIVTYTPKAEDAAGHGEEGGHGEEAAAEGGHGAAEVEGTSVTNPSLKGCHKMKGGAHHVKNGTNTDLKAYVGADCTGESKYVGRHLNGDLPAKADAWNSYSFVG